MRILAVLFLFPSLAFAAPCTTPPKIGLTASDVQIAVTESATKIWFAWPTIDSAVACCIRMPIDSTQWRSALNYRSDSESVGLAEFILTAKPPGGILSDSEIVFCQKMIDKVLGPGPTVVRNSNRVDGSRPLKVLRDPSQTYSSTNPLIDLKVGGVIQYVEAGRHCERTPVVNKTTSGQWLYVTSSAGQRGIALCK